MPKRALDDVILRKRSSALPWSSSHPSGDHAGKHGPEAIVSVPADIT